MKEFKGFAGKIVIDGEHIQLKNWPAKLVCTFDELTGFAITREIVTGDVVYTIYIMSKAKTHYISFKDTDADSAIELFGILRKRVPLLMEYRHPDNPEQVSTNPDEFLRPIENFNPTRVLANCVHINDERKEFVITQPGLVLNNTYLAQSIFTTNAISVIPHVYNMENITDVWTDAGSSQRIAESNVVASAGAAVGGLTGLLLGAAAVTSLPDDKFCSVTWIQMGQTFNEKFEDSKIAKNVENVIRSFIQQKNLSAVVAGKSVAEEIREYKALLDDGIITQGEFDAKKAMLLGI